MDAQPLIDAGMVLADAAMAGPVYLPSPDEDPANFFARVFAAFNDRNWRYLAALTVIGVVFLIRKLLAERIKKLQEGKWAWTLAVAGTGIAALAAHLASDKPIGGLWGVIGAFLSGAFVGGFAAGAVKGVYEWKAKPPVHNEPPPETVGPPKMPLAAPFEEERKVTPPPRPPTRPGGGGR